MTLFLIMFNFFKKSKVIGKNFYTITFSLLNFCSDDSVFSYYIPHFYAPIIRFLVDDYSESLSGNSIKIEGFRLICIVYPAMDAFGITQCNPFILRVTHSDSYEKSP